MGDFGMYEPKFEIKNTYDQKGDFLKKEVYVWNPKYELNEKTGRWDPDYSEKNWTPKYCVLKKNDLLNNFVITELRLWNKKSKAYDEPIEKMIYQMTDANHFIYLAFLKENKYNEIVNNIKYDNGLLFAEIAE